VAAEAVHFCQNLVQGLLSFIVSAAQAGAASAADTVEFIDENN
jgi:hypothetical protein